MLSTQIRLTLITLVVLVGGCGGATPPPSALGNMDGPDLAPSDAASAPDLFEPPSDIAGADMQSPPPDLVVVGSDMATTPTILSFAATPATVDLGQDVTLAWTL